MSRTEKARRKALLVQEPVFEPFDLTGHALHITAPAKINIYLGVHNKKDAAGYHRVDSVMAMLDLADTVTIEPAPELAVLTVPEADFPQEHNTAYKAAVAMGEKFGREPAFCITIEKRIPIRAGLGGPSTDAAAVILGLCHVWGIDPHSAPVDSVARSIGADVPFFLYGPLSYLAGRGDTLRRNLAPLADVPVALVKPLESSVSTIEAYRRFDEGPVPVAPLMPLLNELRMNRLDAILPLMANNLAPAACEIAPEIGEIATWMRAQDGVRIAEVCGSGSTVFAMCATHEDAARIAEQAAREHGWWSYAARTVKERPSISVR